MGLVLILSLTTFSAEEPIILEESSFFDIIRGAARDTIIIGQALLSQGTGTLRADTAIWIKGEKIILVDSVIIRDSLYTLTADRVEYSIPYRQAYAFGDRVVIVSERDSIMAVGTDAWLVRDSSLFRMTTRPNLLLNYQDSLRKISITADRITFDSRSKIGYADGRVVINQEDTESRSGRAIMYLDEEILLLLDSPEATRRSSQIKGDTLVMFMKERSLSRLQVTGKGEGKFREPTRKDSLLFDNSTLTAAAIDFNFKYGELDNIIAGGQAYSFYEPGRLDSSNLVKNTVSGDSIKLFLKNEEINLIQIIGGAEGEYQQGNLKADSGGRYIAWDTVFYKSDPIRYQPQDSLISLIQNASVSDNKVSLSASRIDFNTDRELVTAFADSITVGDSALYQPVVLKDEGQEMFGHYLEYSLKSERGMIKQSKSSQNNSIYRGRELYRAEKETFYVTDGTYTSCDLDKPHYHFYSRRMKVIQNDRVVCRPVIFYIESVPLPPLPYFVFSLKEGRHSGFLPFQFGSFSRGNRRIENVGYYWAASEYWDLLGSLDYYEGFGFKYNGQFRYNVRYKFSGSLAGSYNRESDIDNDYNEVKSTRWEFRADHHQDFSPTFRMDASGTFISDKEYYTDFSLDEDDRLNRSIKSQVALSKKLGSASLTAQFVHTEEIDQESRTDQLPAAGLSLPSRPIFGSPKKDEEGVLQKKWYHTFYSGYSASLRNYSRRTITSDSLRTRKEYVTLTHNTGVTAPFSVLKHVKFNPSLSYNETWYKIFETDQSQAAGIDAGTTYRRWAYAASVSASSDLYGTVYPNVGGVEGLRHVLTPRIGFSWSPEIERHDKIKSYTGVGGGGARSASIDLSLQQLLQARLKGEEESRKIDLVTLNSTLRYNFEAEGRKFSNLSSSASTSLLKNLRVSANWVHDLYKPNSTELNLLSPYLLSFNISTTFSTSGIIGEVAPPPRDDSLKGPGEALSKASTRQNWSLSLTHYYGESGRGAAFTKSHNLRFNFRTGLTRNMNISYSQYYSFDRHRTISRSLEVYRKMHCFEARFTWNIDRNPRGYGFLINVIMIPQIKYEKSETGIRDAFF